MTHRRRCLSTSLTGKIRMASSRAPRQKLCAGKRTRRRAAPAVRRGWLAHHAMPTLLKTRKNPCARVNTLGRSVLRLLPLARSLARSLYRSPSRSLARSLLSLALSYFELRPYIPPHAIVGAASLSYRALVLTSPQVSLLLLAPLVLSFSLK